MRCRKFQILRLNLKKKIWIKSEILNLILKAPKQVYHLSEFQVHYLRERFIQTHSFVHFILFIHYKLSSRGATLTANQLVL